VPRWRRFVVTYLVIYLAGVVLGLAVMRDAWPSRVAIALVWPLGPMAFVVVVTILVMASAVVWPVPVLGAVTLLGLAAWSLL
jgi:hypothetical protein